MKKIGIILYVLLSVSCGRSQEKISSTALLISNVTIIDVRHGNLLEHRHIVVDSGKIKHITQSIVHTDKYSIIIDGKGKYLIPGLAEMHAHIPPPSTSKERILETLFLYLSNGITTIRGMLGHPSHLELRQKAENGQIQSPRIFTSSPSLNGNTVTSTLEAISKVTAYQKEGYDFLKIHPGIKREVFDKVVQTANEVGISFAGHVPVDVGIRHALENKYASIDHVDGFLEGLVPEKENVDPNSNGFFGYNFSLLADVSNIDGLVKLANENNVWIVPTQSLFERWFAPTSADDMLSSPEMKYMPSSTLANWKQRKNEIAGAGANFDEQQWQRFITIRRTLIKKLQEDGKGILLGSDAPQIFNVPGFSIHHEMEAMIKAGLTPLEIIQSGTINPAIFFGMEDKFGEIKEGLDADMILLNSNPMENIKALKQLSGVMVRGVWLSEKSIAQKLDEIAKNAAQN